MESKLEIFTLGGVRILLGGEQLTGFTTRKAEALLIYLASTRRPQPREVLADLLWDERTQSQALGNLRGVLSNLHQVLGNTLLISRDQAELNPANPIWLDANDLEDCLLEVRKQGGLSTITAAQASDALQLYHGDFLAGFTVYDCRGFEEWRTREQERLHRLVVDSLSVLSEDALERREYPTGIMHTTRLLELDPLKESAHRQMMLLLEKSGQRAAALSQYENYQNLLWAEYKTAPTAEMRELSEQIRAGKLGTGIEPDQLYKISPLSSTEGLSPGEKRPARQVGECPYRGLSAFQEVDARFYFGRELFVDALEQTIHAKKLVAVIVGSSGSGKSSALLAGLLPRLRKEEGNQFAVFRPSSQPFYPLAGALLPILESSLSETDRLVETRKLAEAMTNGEVNLAQVVRRILEKIPAIHQVFLIVDQFEELYTLCPEAILRKAFIDQLLAAAETAREWRDGSVVILLTLRADFMGQALAYRPLADALQDASLLMGPMNRQELHQAIEKPAEMQGAAFEAGLVERILDDVGEKPGNLPLLEFTLTQLWERQTDGWLSHSDYEAMGCIEGALATYADQVYGGLSSDEQERTRATLELLVQPGEGTEDTRRIATHEELGDDNWSIIQRLADRRLVVTGRDVQGRETAEVVHEALIQRWGRFQEWLSEDRENLRIHRHLSEAAQEWLQAGKDASSLYRGAKLAQAQEWATKSTHSLHLLEQEFLQVSLEAEQREVTEREAQRRRELEAAQKLAETERQRAEEQGKSAQGLRRRAWLLVGVVVLALILAGAAVLFGQQADKNSRLATSRYLTSEALQNLNSNTQLSAHLALLAYQAYPTYEAESALHMVLPELRLVSSIPITNTLNPMTGMWMGRDGQRLIVATEDGIEVTDPTTGAHSLLAKGEGCNFILPTPDVRWLVTDCPRGGQTGEVAQEVWDIETQKVLFTYPDLKVNPGYFDLIPPSQTHPLLAFGTYTDTTTHVWDATSGNELFVLGNAAVLEPGENYPYGKASPDGKRLATFGSNGKVFVWDMDTGKLQIQFDAQSKALFNVSLSPDGIHLATWGQDNTIKIWDLTSLSLRPRLEHVINHDTTQWPLMTYNPDGTRLAAGSMDGLVRVWDAQTGKLQIALSGHQGETFVYSFSQDGTQLYTGAVDRTIKAWDLAPGRELLTLIGGIGSAPFSPDGKQLALAGADGSLSIVNSQTGEEVLKWQAHSAEIQDVAWSPDGKLLATSSGSSWWNWMNDSTTKIWDPATGQMLKEISGKNYGGFSTIAWSPDSRRLATGSYYSGDTLIWDPASGGLLQEMPQKVGGDWIITYSPDGKEVINGFQGMFFGFDAMTGIEVFTQTAGGHSVFSLAYSPDGQRLAAGASTSIFLYKVTESGLVAETELSTGSPGVMSLAFSPDGAFLAVGDISGAVRVWDLKTRQWKLVIATFSDPVRQVAFSPDGRLVASSRSSDGSNLKRTTYFYTLSVQDLIKMVRSRLVLHMTPDQCLEYLHTETCPAEP